MSGLLVLAPLRLEARAVRSGSPGTRVLRTGMGPDAAARAAETVSGNDATAVCVVGVAGATADRLEPGDVVVACEIRGPEGTCRPCLEAAPLVAALRAEGLRVVYGPVASADHVVRGGERERLAREGVCAVDMESAWLAPGVGARPLGVVRAIVDTPGRELTRPLRTASGGIRALVSLRRAAHALERWAAAAGPRTVLLAGPRSFCAGVERAIEIVERALERFGPPVYVRKQIVHNIHVVRELEARGAVFVEEVDEVPLGSVVVFSAHGVSPEVRRGAAERRLRVLDATCPLVTKVHVEARRFADDGYTVLLIGHEGHEETEGTMGEAPDAIRLVEGAEEVDGFDVPDPDRVAFLTQTTLAVDETREVVDALRRRFPSLRGPRSEDICYATQNRQDAVTALAPDCDVLLVVGSRNSSNSKRLVEVSRRRGCPAHLVDDPTEIDPDWLADARTVGATAGASAPDELVEGVIDMLRGLGPVEVSERRVATESVRFSMPKELR